MTGRENPAEGVPAEGGDDEFRSVEFDESFVRAAQLQEFSAQERMADREHAVRRRPEVPAVHSSSRQGLALLMLIALAFGAAIYLGMSNPPYPPAQPALADPLRIALVPLAPPSGVPGGTPDDLFAHSPAADFSVGADGVTLPSAQSTESFTEQQVMFALALAKEFVVRSSLDPKVLTGGAAHPVRKLLDPGQHDQFDASLERPASDGWHAVTGWMVRLDGAKVALADPGVRVAGTLAITETDSDTLRVDADHVFVYALRAKQQRAGDPDASLFTVRRSLRLHFDRNDLRGERLELHSATVRAGPLDCDSRPAAHFSPLLAGERAAADHAAGTDPYADTRPDAALCGVLPAAAMPTPTGGAAPTDR